MAAVDTTLADLQAGLDATARAAQQLHHDTLKCGDSMTHPRLRAIAQQVKDMCALARDQRYALAELRDALSQLHQYEAGGGRVVRPPPLRRGHNGRAR
jgi:hypothetical protein